MAANFVSSFGRPVAVATGLAARGFAYLGDAVAEWQERARLRADEAAAAAAAAAEQRAAARAALRPAFDAAAERFRLSVDTAVAAYDPGQSSNVRELREFAWKGADPERDLWFVNNELEQLHGDVMTLFRSSRFPREVLEDGSDVWAFRDEAEGLFNGALCRLKHKAFADIRFPAYMGFDSARSDLWFEEVSVCGGYVAYDPKMPDWRRNQEIRKSLWYLGAISGHRYNVAPSFYA